MSKYRFEKEYDDDFAKFETCISFEATSLDEITEYFKMFLQGCGFNIDGDFVIEKIDCEKPSTIDDDGLC